MSMPSGMVEQIGEEQMLRLQSKRVEMIYRNAKAASKPSIEEKGTALRFACLSSVSLPVLAITLVYRMEQEIEARKRADQNYAEYVEAAQVSPGTLDR